MARDEALAVLMGAAQVLEDVTAASLEAAGGLSRMQLWCLSKISRNPGLRLADLALQIDVTPSTAVRQVDRLIAAKLVRRRENPDDRREVRLTLTKQGVATLDAAVRARREAMGEVLDGMSPDETDHLIASVSRFLAAADSAPAELVPTPYEPDDAS